MSDKQNHACPDCGREFEVIWQVIIGSKPHRYQPLAPPGARDIVRCESCDAQFERSGGGEWERQWS